MINTSIQYIGNFVKTFGYKGELILKFDVSIPENFEQIKIIFIKLDGLPVPFFVSKNGIFIKDDQIAFLKLDDINDEEKAQKLLATEISIENYIEQEKIDTSNINSFKNYKIIDVNIGEIGYFEKIIEIPNNPLIQLFKEKNEILLPFTEEIIIKIDDQNKTIEVNTPKGLVDIYLNNE